MDEEKLTAETSEEISQVGSAEPDEEEMAQSITDADFSEYVSGDDDTEESDAEAEKAEDDEAKEGEKEVEPAERPQKKPVKSDKGRDPEQARLRRERERKEAYKRGIMDAVGGVNPYTNEPITDDADVDEYLLMREIDKKGGDPVGDYHRYAKEKRKAQEQAQQESKAASDKREWFAADKAQFEADYPDVDMSKLARDARFQAFARGKIGTEPMSRIYGDFVSLNASFEAKAERMAKNELAKSKASPGSLASSETAESSYETMSDKDFDRKMQAVLRGEEKI